MIVVRTCFYELQQDIMPERLKRDVILNNTHIHRGTRKSDSVSKAAWALDSIPGSHKPQLLKEGRAINHITAMHSYGTAGSKQERIPSVS